MIKTIRLPNGITCVCEERPKSGKVSMLVAIKAGSMHEALNESGLTHLMQDVALGGTTTKTRDQIAEEIESRGGSFGSDTDRSTTKFVASALARDAGDIFAVLADVIRNPVFADDEIKNSKTRIAYMIDEENQSPAHKAGDGFYNAAFAGQAVAVSSLGTKDLVAGFTAAQIRTSHENLLAHTDRIVVSFAGDITAELAEKLAITHFGDLKPGTPRAPENLKFTGGDIREANDNNQLNLVFGFEAPGIEDPKRYHLTMLKELISGGMSSPLFQEIREKRGLVYSVGAGFSPMESAGLFYIQAGTGKGNAGELIPVAFDLLGQVVRDGFTPDDINKARERIIRSTKSALESMKAACFRNASQILNFGRIVTLDEIDAALSRVTSDDIRTSTAAMLSSGRYALGGVGPLDSMPTGQDIQSMMAAQIANISIPASVPVAVSKDSSTTSTAVLSREIAADPKVSTLKNGMIVVTAERPGSLACGAWVGAGADHETATLNGATHMNEHMMFKGTPHYGPGTIDKIVEGELGANLNAYTSKDQTAYYFYDLLPNDLEKIVDICGEMVFKANLDHEEFDGTQVKNPDGTITKAKGERDVVIEEIKRANDNIGSRMWDLLGQTMCPDQPHGRPVLGTETTLRNMTVQALAAYRDEYYVANNVVFSASGPVSHDDFVALIEHKFGAMPKQNIPALPTPSYHGGSNFLEMDSAELCQFVLAAQSVPSTHPDIHAYNALGEILGGGASSRLYKALVNTSLTSDIGAGCNDYHNFGSFIIVAGIDPADTKDVVGIIYSEIRNLLTTLDQKELDKAKAQMEMAILSGVETNRTACDTYGQQTLALGHPEPPAAISAKIQALTLADIDRAARAILACEPVLAGIVPKGTDSSLLPDMAELRALRSA